VQGWPWPSSCSTNCGAPHAIPFGGLTVGRTCAGHALLTAVGLLNSIHRRNSTLVDRGEREPGGADRAVVVPLNVLADAVLAPAGKA
jgi:hypothetical protein